MAHLCKDICLICHYRFQERCYRPQIIGKISKLIFCLVLDINIHITASHFFHSFLQLFYRLYYGTYQDRCHNNGKDQCNDNNYDLYNKQDVSGLHGRIVTIINKVCHLIAKLIQNSFQLGHFRVKLIDKRLLCLLFRTVRTSGQIL